LGFETANPDMASIGVATLVQKLTEHAKSSKHRKAEGLIEKGQPIRIIRETDFKEMVTLT